MSIVPFVVSLLPVLFFLTALVLVDSYKLVRFVTVVMAVAVGATCALVAYFLSAPIVDLMSLSTSQYSRWVAPILEESLKAILILYLIKTDRIGFTVDAAILGFAVGAGFGCLENIYYIGQLGTATPSVWLVRGFGTAIMHGGTTAVFAILAKTGHDSEAKYPVRPLLAALGASAVIHIAHNRFVLPPKLNMLVVLVGFSVLIGALVVLAERRTREWLGTGFDTDQELLNLLLSGKISDTRVGQYLRKLRGRFAGPIVADMLCLIRIRVELSLRAKGLLMMREAGFSITVGPDIKDKFEELQYLERSIGRVGLLAIEPIHRWSKRDLWQLTLLDSH